MENSKLTNDALAVFFGTFVGPRTTLRMNNVCSVLSPRATVAMAELINRGWVCVKKDGSADIYYLTEYGGSIDRQAVMPNVLGFLKEHGRFPIAASRGVA